MSVTKIITKSKVRTGDKIVTKTVTKVVTKSKDKVVG